MRDITIAATSRSWRLSQCQRSRPRLRATWRGGNARRRVLGAAWPCGHARRVRRAGGSLSRSRTPGPQRSRASAEAWVASGRWEAGGEGPRSLSRTVCQVGGPQRIRARVPAPPHAFASESPTCGAMAGAIGTGRKRCRTLREQLQRPGGGATVPLTDARKPRRFTASTICSTETCEGSNATAASFDRRLTSARLTPFSPSRAFLTATGHLPHVMPSTVNYGQPAGDTLSHFMSSIVCPEALP